MLSMQGTDEVGCTVWVNSWLGTQVLSLVVWHLALGDEGRG